ncbi:septum formation protein Maf [gamma proteobacterium HTCC5015]|nr:septum formation protein Maf [gamma proteobacterium HTCC5015]
MIYLASQSPRRRQLLAQMGVPFEAFSVDIDEAQLAEERAEQLVARLALAKAREGQRRLQERGVEHPLVLGSDTEVVLDGEALGKPQNQQHAAAMLKQLAGRSHRVLCAVALVQGEREWVETVENTVHMAALSEAEIERYWQTGEPIGKAGGYGIQGAAAAFIRHIEGSYSAVMGLPLYQTAELLRQVGVDYWQFSNDGEGDAL